MSKSLWQWWCFITTFPNTVHKPGLIIVFRNPQWSSFLNPTSLALLESDDVSSGPFMMHCSWLLPPLARYPVFTGVLGNHLYYNSVSTSCPIYHLFYRPVQLKRQEENSILGLLQIDKPIHKINSKQAAQTVSLWQDQGPRPWTNLYASHPHGFIWVQVLHTFTYSLCSLWRGQSMKKHLPWHRWIAKQPVSVKPTCSCQIYMKQTIIFPHQEQDFFFFKEGV